VVAAKASSLEKASRVTALSSPTPNTLRGRRWGPDERREIPNFKKFEEEETKRETWRVVRMLHTALGAK
jgi:hypothetical protein